MSLPMCRLPVTCRTVTAAVHGMDYLVTWNCKHIANAAMRHRIEAICCQRGVDPPTICTPEELLET
jgi:hypothetical protein